MKQYHLVCVVWTLVILEEGGDEKALWDDQARLGTRLSQAQEAFDIESLVAFSEEVESSLPERERRRVARNHVS